MVQWHLVVLASLQKHSKYCSSLHVQVHMDLCVLYSSPNNFYSDSAPTNASHCRSLAHLELHWVMWQWGCTGLSSQGMKYSPHDTKQGQPGQPNEIRFDNGIKFANFPMHCENRRILANLCNVASPSCAINSLTNSNNKYIKIQIKNVAKYDSHSGCHTLSLYMPRHMISMSHDPSCFVQTIWSMSKCRNLIN